MNRAQSEPTSTAATSNEPPPIDNVVLHTCGHCSLKLPITEFYSRPDCTAVRVNCVRCCRRQERQRQQTLRRRTNSQIKAQQTAMHPDGRKYCRSCKQTHRLKAFNKNRAALDGLQSRCRMAEEALRDFK